MIVKDVIILIDFFPMDLDDLDILLDDLNQDISSGKYNTKDMYLMGFHPEDESNELLDDSLDMEEDAYSSLCNDFLSEVK